MSYKILFSAKATEDLQNILLYIAETNSPQVALNYIDKIEETINKLKEFPHLGKIPIQRNLRLQNFRVLTVESHLIYYKAFENDKIIKIYTVRHARQKQLNIKQ